MQYSYIRKWVMPVNILFTVVFCDIHVPTILLFNLTKHRTTSADILLLKNPCTLRPFEKTRSVFQVFAELLQLALRFAQIFGELGGALLALELFSKQLFELLSHFAHVRDRVAVFDVEEGVHHLVVQSAANDVRPARNKQTNQ